MEFRTWRRRSLTVEKTSMRFADHDMPGHKVRRNKDGTVRHGWAARHDLVKRGYRPKWVRLHYHFNDQAERLLAAAQCQHCRPKCSPGPAACGPTISFSTARLLVSFAPISAIGQALTAVSNGIRGERMTRFSA